MTLCSTKPKDLVKTEKNQNKKRSKLLSHWPKLCRTFVLFLSQFIIGVFNGIRGPTMMDLADLLKTDIETMSLTVMVTSWGAMVGSFVGGYVLDKFSKFEYFIMAFCVVMFGLCTGLFPYAGNIYWNHVFSLGVGVFAGCICLGSNVMCLNIWHGFNAGPCIQFVALGYGCGAFIGPLIASNFLSTTLSNSTSTGANSTMTLANSTTIYEEMIFQNNTEDNIDINDGNIRENDSSIDILFPIVGLVIASVAIGFIYYGFAGLRQSKKDQSKMVNEKAGDEDNVDKTNNTVKIILITLMSLMIFTYVGMEFSYTIYLAPFAVKCKLKLNQQTGAQLTSIFFMSFTLARVCAIFISMKLRSTYFMCLCLMLFLTGSTIMLIWGEKSYILLQIGNIFLGAGMSPTFGVALAWLADHMRVTNKIGCILTNSAIFGTNITPLIFGQYIETHPMILSYSLTVTVMTMIILFGAAVFVSGCSISKESNKNRLSGSQAD